MPTTPAEEFFLDIADQAGVGGKARSLARLGAAGLPTPVGFVVGDPLFRALVAAEGDRPLPSLAEAAIAVEKKPLPPGFSRELARRLEALGGETFSVRSSFSAEDAPGAVAAGVYESRTGIPAAGVETALRQVLRSAVGPAAAAYASARGKTPGEPPVSVLVHRHLAGEFAGGAAFDPAASDRPAVLDVRFDGAGEGRLPDRVRDTLEAALRRLAGQFGGVEIEWVASEGEVTFLQLRPFRAPAASRPWPGLAELPGEASAWHWDAAHNPLPLTPAQAGLVALVDRHCPTGLRQRVAGGYLFSAEGGPAAPRKITPAEIESTLSALGHEAEVALAGLGDPPALAPALATFCGFYTTMFGVLGPALRQARSQLAAFLRAHLPAALPTIPALLTGVESYASERRRRAERIARAGSDQARRRALAGYLALFGEESSVWDVAAPTHREQPDRLLARLCDPGAREARPGPDWRAAADGVAANLPPALHATWEERLQEARAAVAAGEDDDRVYARLQSAVRRALLALGRRLTGESALDVEGDVFYLPLGDLSRYAAGGGWPGPPRDLARAGRTGYEAALRDPPALDRLGGGAGAPGTPLRGTGTGGRALGRVYRHDPTRAAAPADAVLVATTLLPTELPLIEVAALVTETGGPLDHVAAQARERGLPAVVGAAGACARLHEGELVLVDADAGVVVPLTRVPA
jgi:phosphohistidine swiveling domain-containing protein